MKILKHTNQSKKLILVIVCIMLFSFCCPRPVHAWLEMEDILIAPAKILYFMENGFLRVLNNIFCDKDRQDDGKIYLSPESIIKGQFMLMDANIFKDISEGDSYYFDSGAMSTNEEGKKEVGTSIRNGREELRNTISGWYYALRNLAIIALLSILVYIGIRMLMTSVSQDKAKYKMMLKDWLVALVLLFAMHYIMIGILNLSSEITMAIGTSGKNSNWAQNSMTIIENVTGKEADKEHYIWEDKDGLVGDKNKEYDTGDAYAQVFVFGAIILYTIIFAIKYLKRMITIIFLILIAPISCITYPIDKIGDSKAQAYNMWFQEFLYEVIIQPFHLLIYVVLVGSATTLANTNILYGIMCFAVMIPAEKFIKQMFGFKDKLASPLGAFASGALASKAMNAIRNAGSKGKSGKDGENDSIPEKLPNKKGENNDLIDGNSRDQLGDDSRQAREQENSNTEEDKTTDTRAEDNNLLNDKTEDEGIENNNNPTDDKIPEEGKEDKDATNENEINDKTRKEKLNDIKEKVNNKKEEAKEKIGNSKIGKAYKRVSNSKVGKLASKANSIHNQRMVKKYGTLSKGKRWVGRAKKALKVGAIATAGTFATMGALATGNLKEAGAVAGGMLITGARGVIKGTTGAARDYSGRLKSDKGKEKKAYKEYRDKQNHQINALNSYRRSHNGEDPRTNKEWENELKDRFELSRYGLSEDQIDKALPIYQEKRDQLVKSGIDEEKAKRIAASQTELTAQYAERYKPAEFEDPKKMQLAYDSLKETLKSETKCDDATADKYARQYLTNAGRMHSVKSVKLPSRESNQTVDIPLTRRTANLANALGIAGPEYTEEQASVVHNLNVKLHDQGYSDADINAFAQSVADSKIKPEGVIKNFENLVNASVEYVEDGNARQQAEKLVRAQHEGKAPKEQVDAEMRERFILKSTFNVKNEKDISAMRDHEVETTTEKTQIQAAREFAMQNKGRFGDTKHIDKQRSKLAKNLHKAGNGKISMDEAKKQAENVAKQAEIYESHK